MTYKLLRKEIKTRYIIDSLEYELRNLFASCDSWDLAGCKFGPKCEKVLREHYATHMFINSEDETLNTLLEENCRRARTVYNTKEFIDLRVSFDGESDLLDYLKTIKLNEKYRLPDGETSDVAAAVIILIEMLLPGVCIDANYMMYKIFSEVRDKWDRSSGHNDAYWMIDGMTMIKIDIVDGKATLNNGQVIDEDDLVRLYQVIPYKFGTERLAEDLAYDGVWISALETVRNSVRKEKTLLSYL